jgi:hypothetical protein
VEPPSITRRPGTNREIILNLAIATCIAIIAGVEVFFFSTNPLVFMPVGFGVGIGLGVSIGFGVGIVSFKMNDKIKLLILGALVGGAWAYLFVVLSSIFRYMLVWIGVSISTLIAMFLALLPRIRQRFAWKAVFSVSFACVCFIATLVIFATFLSPISFLQMSGVQASFVAVNSPNDKMLLVNYTAQVNDSVAGLNYLQLLNWTRRHLTWGTATSQTNPIEILKIGRGACEDYAWVYVGLLVANNHTARLILDCSYSLWPIKEAGNHSWVEVFINGTWVPIDPSVDPSYGVNNPYLYARGWNKTINHIYAITENGILDVTPSYIPPS